MFGTFSLFSAASRSSTACSLSTPLTRLPPARRPPLCPLHRFAHDADDLLGHWQERPPLRWRRHSHAQWHGPFLFSLFCFACPSSVIHAAAPPLSLPCTPPLTSTFFPAPFPVTARQQLD
jgi:hypothetical protein